MAVNPAYVSSISDKILVGDLPGGQIVVTIDYAEIEPRVLFNIAARNNPKRSFLFLSNVLGKHLPVTPTIMEDIHERIARHIPDLPQPIVFIGMAETATCLGQGVFESWSRSNPCDEVLFLHTTRYRVDGADSVCFEEAHSHAPILWLYQPNHQTLRKRFRQAKSIVFIDDEISTGNTFVNLAKACRGIAPFISHIHLATITDFGGKEGMTARSGQFGTEVSSGALVQGGWHFESNGGAHVAVPLAQCQTTQVPSLIDNGFGRLGRDNSIILPQEQVEAFAKSMLPCERVLVLGTGEFMHSAFVLARELYKTSGAKVYMHATTRSPITLWGDIHSVLSFPDNYGEGIPNYLYNCTAGQYDHILLCHETGPTSGLMHVARQLGARLLHFHSESEIEENTVY